MIPFGKKLLSSTIGSRVATGGALGAVGAGSFLSGVDSDRQVTNSMYNLAFGDPHYDKYVTGTDVSLRSIVAPYPGERLKQGSFPFTMLQTPVGTAAGFGTGAAAGGLIGKGLRLGGVKGAIAGGLFGGIMGNKIARAPSGAIMNSRTYTDAWQRNRKNRPEVDGSVAFGMYNARLG